MAANVRETTSKRVSLISFIRFSLQAGWIANFEPPRPEGRRFLDYAQRYSAHVSVYRLIPTQYVDSCVVVCIVLIPTGPARSVMVVEIRRHVPAHNRSFSLVNEFLEVLYDKFL